MGPMAAVRARCARAAAGLAAGAGRPLACALRPAGLGAAVALAWRLAVVAALSGRAAVALAPPAPTMHATMSTSPTRPATAVERGTGSNITRQPERSLRSRSG